jgi:hypothetical protein
MNMIIDVPTAPSQTPYYTGTVTFAGWTVEPNASIKSVLVTVDGVPFGNAAVHAYRPDVCAAYGSPDCPNVGWTFVIDTGLLNNNQHTLAITATTTNGQSSTITQLFTTQN